MRYKMEQLDMMEGHEFEYAVADLLRHNGWRDVEVTQGSGDYGIDILARRKSTRYAIQCKRYKSAVGVKAVQEAGLGTDYYHCDAAAVITNCRFTKNAQNLANTTGVKLWDRDFLAKLIEGYEDEYDELDPQAALAGIREKPDRRHRQGMPEMPQRISEQFCEMPHMRHCADQRCRTVQTASGTCQRDNAFRQ